MSVFWLAWNAVSCTLEQRRVSFEIRCDLYIELFGAWRDKYLVISCRNEKGGVFGERVFFKRLFTTEKTILLVIQNTRSL